MGRLEKMSGLRPYTGVLNYFPTEILGLHPYLHDFLPTISIKAKIERGVSLIIFIIYKHKHNYKRGVALTSNKIYQIPFLLTIIYYLLHYYLKNRVSAKRHCI